MPAPLLVGRTGRQRRRVGTLWGNRDFVLLWSGQTASVLGSRASALAFPLLVLELHNPPPKPGWSASSPDCQSCCASSRPGRWGGCWSAARVDRPGPSPRRHPRCDRNDSRDQWGWGLLGALLAPRLVRTIAAGWLNITGIWICGLLIALLALVPSAVAITPIIAAIAVIGPVLAVVAQTRRALLIPPHLLGRVYSVTLVISGSTAPLGSLLAGFLLSWLGGPATCAVLGTGFLIIAAAATASPTIRHADLPTVATDLQTGTAPRHIVQGNATHRAQEHDTRG